LKESPSLYKKEVLYYKKNEDIANFNQLGDRLNILSPNREQLADVCAKPIHLQLVVYISHWLMKTVKTFSEILSKIDTIFFFNCWRLAIDKRIRYVSMVK
jgi:hypothetical protein